MKASSVVAHVDGFYRVIRLAALRRTPGVAFDVIPREHIPRVDAIDRVIHTSGAISPGPVGEIPRPWYMHPHQDDNLLVLHGTRYVDLYDPSERRLLSFIVQPDKVTREDELICDGPCLLVWPKGVFHRIQSDVHTGSASVNLATHHPGFDIRTNFNIYELDTTTGVHQLLREGARDQLDKPEQG